MQRYQVFIDDHSIYIGENRKSNQQSESIFELFDPTKEDIQYVTEWLFAEKESIQHLYLNSKDVLLFWELFQKQYKYIEAAGGLVRNAKGEILFIHRLGKWDLPKGKMESEETPEQSALREVEEECGISNLRLGKKLPDTFHIYHHKEKYVLKRTHWFEMHYNGSEELIPQQEEAIEAAMWIDPSDLGDQLSNTYASLKGIIRAIVKK